MNKKIIIGNWKMNLNSDSSLRLIKEIKKKTNKEDFKNTNVILCPSFIHLDAAKKILPKEIVLGSQNVFWEDEGAYTGEISPRMIKKIGCKYAIVGHSERRLILKETDDMVNKKVIACLNNNINPILCVGEDYQERKMKRTEVKIINQVVSGLKDVKREDIKKIIFAYEPIWAIGTDNPANPDDAEEVAIYIKKIIGRYKKYKEFNKIKVVYGGSVDSKNIRSFADMNNIEGSLVGGESLKAKAFTDIIKNSYN